MPRLVQSIPRSDATEILANVHQLCVRFIDINPSGSREVDPLRLELAVRVEDLHPPILSVGHEDVTVTVRRDVVNDVELARIGAGLTPREHQLTVRRVLVYTGVAVSVGDVHVAIPWVDREMGWGAERVAAHLRRWVSFAFDLQQ